MPDCFFDTSALGKHYHPEVGPHFHPRNSSSADSPQPTTFERSTPSSWRWRGASMDRVSSISSFAPTGASAR